jgi:hypothetical protein
MYVPSDCTCHIEHKNPDVKQPVRELPVRAAFVVDVLVCCCCVVVARTKFSLTYSRLCFIPSIQIPVLPFLGFTVMFIVVYIFIYFHVSISTTVFIIYYLFATTRTARRTIYDGRKVTRTLPRPTEVQTVGIHTVHKHKRRRGMSRI